MWITLRCTTWHWWLSTKSHQEGVCWGREEWAKSQASFFSYSHRTRPLVAITKNAPAQRWKLHSWLLLGCSLSVGIGTDLLLPDRTSLWQPEVLKHWILGKTCLSVARMLVQGRVISVTEKFGLFLFQNSTNHHGRRWWLLSRFVLFLVFFLHRGAQCLQ